MKKNWHIILIALLLIIYSLQFFHFVCNNTAIPQGDALPQSGLSARVYWILKGDRPFWQIGDLVYPPLVYVISALFFSLFGLSPTTALFSQYVFSLVFLLSLYGIGSRLGEKLGGICVLLLGMACPYLIYYSEHYFLDLPAAAMVMLCLYLLLKTEDFFNLKYSILFGIFLGFAQLTKWNCAIFILPPALALLCYVSFKNWKRTMPVLFTLLVSSGLAIYYIHLGIRSQKPEFLQSYGIQPYHFAIFLIASLGLAGAIILHRRRVSSKDNGHSDPGIFQADNGCISLAAAQVITYPVYLYHIGAFFGHFHGQTRLLENYNFPGILISNLQQLSWAFPLAIPLLITGIVFAVTDRKNTLYFILLGISALFGLITASATAPSSARYVLAAAGIMAVFGGFWMGRLSRYKYVLAGILGILCLLPYFAYFMGFPLLQKLDTGEFGAGKFNPALLIKPLPYRAELPDRGDYHLQEIMETVRQAEENPDLPGRFIYLEGFVTEGFNEFTMRKKLPEVRHDFLIFMTEYCRKKGEKISTRNFKPIEAAKEIKGPFYIAVFYHELEEIKNLADEIQYGSGKTAKLIKKFTLPGERNAGVIRVKNN